MKGDDKIYPRNPITVTLVSFLMASLVVLVVDLIRIYFANKKLSVTQQFSPFIGKDFGFIFPRGGKNLALLFIPEISASSVTFSSPPPFISNTPLAPSSTAIKFILGRGSRINHPARQSNDKRLRFFTISALLAHLSSPNKKLIPISINNSLSSVYLNIGLIMNNENKNKMLVDTGAAMNTGNKDHYLWVISQCPSMIAEYLACGADAEYDVVQLLVDLDFIGTH